MAKSGLDIGSLIKWGLLLGGGYYLYETYVSSSSSSSSSTPAAGGGLTLADLTTAIKNALGGSSSSTTTAPATPPPVAGPSTIAALRAAILSAAGVNAYSANSGYVLNADQWNYYRNNVQPPALSGDQFGQVIAALDPTVNRNALTIDQFLAALQKSGVVSGLSGLGLGAVTVTVPLLVNRDGRKGIVWASYGDGVPSAPRGGSAAQPLADHPRPNYRRTA